MRYKVSEERLGEVVKSSLSIAQVCRELGIRPVGGNYKTLKAKIKQWSIDISHFTGSAWNQGNRFKPFGKKLDLEDVLTKNSTYTNSSSLKKRLIKEGLLGYKCQICDIKEWNNKVVVLELDHINGNNTDNRIDNLRLLCPNCHSQTATFRGKSKWSALSERREVEYRKFREALTSNVDGNPEPSLKSEEGAETLHDTPKE